MDVKWPIKRMKFGLLALATDPHQSRRGSNSHFESAYFVTREVLIIGKFSAAKWLAIIARRATMVALGLAPKRLKWKSVPNRLVTR